MNWINKNNVTGYFGCLEDNLYDANQYNENRFLAIIKKVEAKTNKTISCVFFPKQIHTAKVAVIDNTTDLKKPLHLFHENADAIITKQKNIAIGVVTADCLPVFLYDAKNQAIGVIHAGWRGAANIITETILKMHNHFGTHPDDLYAYLGPSAGVCCYEVQSEFLSHFPESIFGNQLIEKRSGKLFFNPKNAGISELLQNNLSINNIDPSHHACTICHEQYCSVRRQKEKAGRQPSLIFLH
jgi:hypothetical protein